LSVHDTGPEYASAYWYGFPSYGEAYTGNIRYTIELLDQPTYSVSSIAPPSPFALSLRLAEKDLDITELRPLYFLSTNDALEKDQVLRENYIEFATEVLSLGRLFTDGPENLLRFIRNLGTARAAHAIDNLADLTLWYNFGVVPTLALSRELTSELHSLVSRLRTGVPSVLHGQFKHYEEESETSIVVRSKVVCNADDLNSLSQLLLALIRVGLSPTPEQIWEAVPFSFLIDKVSKTGTWLSSVDQFIKLNYIYKPSYFVHSISLTREVTDEVMSLMFDTESYTWDGEIKWCRYLRDVSVFSPYLRPDPYGIILPDQQFDLATTSSLLWKRARS
jgi:hypothetical protein